MDNLKKNFIYNSIYQLISMIIPLITTPYISRVLGAKEIGDYSFSYSIAMYFSLFIIMGINNYGNRSIASSKDNKDNLSKIFWSIFSMQVCSGIFVTVLYLLYVFFISDNIIFAKIMYLHLFSVCIDVNWALYGLEEFKLSTIRSFIVRIISTLCIFIFVNNNSDIYLYSLIVVITNVLNQILIWPKIISEIKFRKPKLSDIVIHIKPNLVLFFTVLAISVYSIMDKIMLGILSSSSEVGYYELAQKIIGLPIAFVVALGNVMLPRVSNMVANGMINNDSMLEKSVKLSTFISTSLSFGIMSVSSVFVPVFYGEGFGKIEDLFLILLPSSIFIAFGNVIRTQYILPMKKDSIYVKSAIIGAVVNLIINILLIRKYGAVGAAIGTFFSELVVVLYQVYKVKSELNIGKYIKSTFPFIISGIIMFTVVYYLNLNIKNNFLILLIKIVLGFIVYIISYAVLNIGKIKNGGINFD